MPVPPSLSLLSSPTTPGDLRARLLLAAPQVAAAVSTTGPLRLRGGRSPRRSSPSGCIQRADYPHKSIPRARYGRRSGDDQLPRLRPRDLAVRADVGDAVVGLGPHRHKGLGDASSTRRGGHHRGDCARRTRCASRETGRSSTSTGTRTTRRPRASTSRTRVTSDGCTGASLRSPSIIVRRLGIRGRDDAVAAR